MEQTRGEIAKIRLGEEAEKHEQVIAASKRRQRQLCEEINAAYAKVRELKEAVGREERLQASGEKQRDLALEWLA